jgi:recombination protein RecT
VIGYVSYFALINGFEKMFYMSKEEAEAHGKKYSKSYDRMWSSDFDAMATKTVIKLILSKYAPLSIEMEKAIEFDQGIIEDDTLQNVSYIDNPPLAETENIIDPEVLQFHINSIARCTTLEQLDEWKKQNRPTHKEVLLAIKNHADTIKASIQD